MNKELTNVQDAQLPAFLQEDENLSGSGLDEMAQYIIPPRLKIIQRNAQDEAYQKFKPGTVIVTPQNVVVAEPDDEGFPFFTFTPIYIFTEFCLVNPYQMRSSLPMIRERTFDPHSELAQKCREMVSEPCPENDKFEMSYMTQLNFLVVLHDSPLGNIPVMLTCSGGEYKYGSSALGLMQMRGKKYYACNFQGLVSEHANQSGQKWLGLDISNPSQPTSPWVQDEILYRHCKQLHDDMKTSKESIRADYEDKAQEEVNPDFA